MKRLIGFWRAMAAIACVACVVACSSDADDDERLNEIYVRYEVEMYLPSDFGATAQTIWYTTPEGERQVRTYDSEWSAVVGPFERGTKVALRAVPEMNSNEKEHNAVRIYVGSGDERFVLCAEATSNRNFELSTSYDID